MLGIFAVVAKYVFVLSGDHLLINDARSLLDKL